MKPKSEDKARKMLEEGRVVREVETDKRTHFRVLGETEEHSVIFDKRKGEWTCDCRYSALTNRECSHIMAAKMKAKG